MSRTLSRVDVEHRGRLAVAIVSGEVDISNAEYVEEELESAAADGHHVLVVDLSRVDFFDSAGIRLLFILAARLHTQRQELHIVVPQDAIVRRVIEITNLAHAVPVHTSIQEIAEGEGF